MVYCSAPSVKYSYDVAMVHTDGHPKQTVLLLTGMVLVIIIYINLQQHTDTQYIVFIIIVCIVLYCILYTLDIMYLFSHLQ